MKKAFFWFFLLNKRLYKKPVFVIILALIPLLMFSFGAVARGESGFIRIALARTDKNDTLSGDIVSGLLKRDSLILFTEAETPDDAVDMVKSGTADAAWVFPADTKTKVEAFSASHLESDYVVDVFQRENTIPLKLACEILSSEFFSHCSRTMYINYIRGNIKALDSVPDSELYKHYDEFERDNELFQFSDADSGNPSGNNYLLSPLRGLLSVIVLLCGLAATLFFIQDKKSGTFAFVPEQKLPIIGFVCQLIAILNVGIVMLLSLFISGLSVFPVREIIMLLLFCTSCASFCSILHIFVKDIKFFGALIPLIVILSIAICPVFFDFGSVHSIQQFLPPTHYINSAYDNTAFLYMAIYSGATFVLFLVVSKLSAFFGTGGAK